MIAAYTEGDEPVPGFRLVKLLAWEAFGSVWKAIGPGGMEAAVKIVSLVNKQRLKEFHALRLVKHIRHPNLVPILAFWLKDRQGNFIDESLVEDADSLLEQPVDLIMVMGLGDKSLYNRLQEHRQEGRPGIPPEELLSYMEDVAQALDHLNQQIHDLGAGPVAIQHCDIKPQNILVVGGAAQVCDLGGARMVEGVTHTAAVGSAAYMAPEYITEGRPSRATDQYSLAVSYVELRTGALPLSAKSPAAAYFTHMRGALDLSQLSPAERQVVARATSVRPDNRYPTCSAMVQALKEACDLRETVRPTGVLPTALTLNALEDQKPRLPQANPEDALEGPPARVEDSLDSAVDLAGALAESSPASDMTFLGCIPEDAPEGQSELVRTTVVQVSVLESLGKDGEGVEGWSTPPKAQGAARAECRSDRELMKTPKEESWPDTSLPLPPSAVSPPFPVDPTSTNGTGQARQSGEAALRSPQTPSTPAVAAERPPSSPTVPTPRPPSLATLAVSPPAGARRSPTRTSPSWRRQRLPLPLTVAAASFVGLLGAWLARNPAPADTGFPRNEPSGQAVGHQTPSDFEPLPRPANFVAERHQSGEPVPGQPPERPPPTLASFVLERSSRPFATLASAVAEAADGDTITIHGDGPFAIEALDLNGKALTLRAASGSHPLFQMASHSGNRSWQPLFTSDRSLILEGLHLRRESAGTHPGVAEPAPLISCEGGALRLDRCRLEVPQGSAAILCRNARQVELRECTLLAANLGLCAEVGEGTPCELSLLSNSIQITSAHGAALSLWAPEVRRPSPIHLRLEHNTIAAARIAALKALPEAIDVETRDNDFTFADAVLSYMDFPAPDGWKQATRWHGRENRYHASGDWLRVNGVPGGVRDLEGWRQLWLTDTSSLTQGDKR